MTVDHRLAEITIVLKEEPQPAASQILVVIWMTLFDLTGDTKFWRQVGDRMSFRDRRDRLEDIQKVLRTGDLDDTRFYLGEEPSEGTNTRRYMGKAFDPHDMLQLLLGKIKRVEVTDIP